VRAFVVSHPFREGRGMGGAPRQVTDEAHNPDSSAVSRNYILLLSDGSTWYCSLSGMSE